LRNRPWRNRRAMVGVDTAIILIAFVLVAAAVAFVVLDMGMTSAQKAKQSMENGLQQASTALQVNGEVMAYVNTNGYVQDIFIPLGVTPGTGYVSFAKNLLSVSLIAGNMSYANIYNGVNETTLNYNTSNLTAIASYYDKSYPGKSPRCGLLHTRQHNALRAGSLRPGPAGYTPAARAACI